MQGDIKSFNDIVSNRDTFAMYQRATLHWLITTFGQAYITSLDERALRFFEEAGELCQSAGMTKEQALAMVEYTWSREPGEPVQELGGATVTLSLLATALGLQHGEAARNELQRCWDNQKKIRAKAMAKELRGHDLPQPEINQE